MTTLIVGLCGGSGSGKTTIADLVPRLLKEVKPTLTIAVLAQDDYYRNNAAEPGFDPATYDFDHPQARDIALLCDHLAALKRGEPVARPSYDFENHCRTNQTRPVEPHDVVLVEGTHMLCDAQLRTHLDLSVYVDAPEAVRLLRRLMRDIAERGRTLHAAAAQYLHTVKPGHDAWTEAFAEHADLIVPGGTALGEDEEGAIASAQLVTDAIIQRLPPNQTPAR